MQVEILCHPANTDTYKMVNEVSSLRSFTQTIISRNITLLSSSLFPEDVYIPATDGSKYRIVFIFCII